MNRCRHGLGLAALLLAASLAPALSLASATPADEQVATTIPPDRPAPVLSAVFAIARQDDRAEERVERRLQLAALGVTNVTAAFPDTREAILDRFQHLEFESPEAALAALPALRELSFVERVEPLYDSAILALEYPDDPYFEVWPWAYPEDPQWALVNEGHRLAAGRCGPARAGADIGIEALWRRAAEAQAMGGGGALEPRARMGCDEMVIGMLDVGVLDAHPDLRVLPDLSSDPRLSVCTAGDRCGDHGTKMAGFAGARTGNGVGVAGVCSDCEMLDYVVPACACSKCDRFEENCQYISYLWSQKLVSSLDVPLGTARSGRPRQLKVVNASFAGSQYAPLESFAALWTAYERGVLVVGATGDQSLTTPSPRYPANVPFVLGVGGSTWEDRFWDTRRSCYLTGNGATLGDRNVDLVAPCSGGMVTTFAFENPGGGGPYAVTSGQCSAAAALVSGAAGYLQSFALEQSPLARFLSPDDTAGLLLATSRGFAADPTLDPTCPPSLCPREMYGAGILDLENAVYVLEHAREWETKTLGLESMTSIERLGPDYVFQGSTWREYRVRYEIDLPARSHRADEPEDLPPYVAWPLHLDSTARCGYGLDVARISYALTGATGIDLWVDRETGRLTIQASQFTRLVNEFEVPLVPWDDFQVAYRVWPGKPGKPSSGEPQDNGLATSSSEASPLGPELRALPNPFRDFVVLEATAALPSGSRLTIYDAAGRLVRELPLGYSAGPRPRWTWDGRDSEGRSVPLGWYWGSLGERGSRTRVPLVKLR